MIVFDLKCSKGHTFEEWFDSSADFEARTKAGEIACPECGDNDTAKALMAPNLSTKAASGAPPPCGDAGGCANAPICPMAGHSQDRGQ